jgi:hypothetical protein
MILLGRDRRASRALCLQPPAAFVLVASAALGCGAASDGSAADASPTTSYHDASSSDVADTGPSDGAAVASDAADAGSNPSLCSAAFLFCDGFEQGYTHWSQTYVSGATVTTDSTHVYRGAHALHAHVDPVADAGATAYGYVQQIQSWPAHFFARLFVYQPSPPPGSPVGLIDMLQQFSPYAGIELLTDPPPGGLAMKTYATSQDQAWQSDAGATATDEWACVELEVDTTAETSHVYVNGTEVAGLAKTSLSLPPLGILGVGLSFYLPGVQGAQDGWIDEVAVNGTRIGCAN